ncbi:MAG: hypothetical protein ACI35O_06030 [Bacillaceae bacterium]
MKKYENVLEGYKITEEVAKRFLNIVFPIREKIESVEVAEKYIKQLPHMERNAAKYAEEGL